MLNKFVYFLNISAAICLLLSLLAPLIDPNKVQVFSLLGLVFPLIIAANLGFIIYWILKGKIRQSILSILCLLCSWSSLESLVQFNGKGEEVSSGIKLMSYNIRGVKLSVQNSKDVSKVESLLNKKRDLDIICIQEKRRDDRSVVNKVLSSYNVISSDFGTAIYTKYPMLKKGVVQVKGNTKEAVWADIKIDSNNICRVYSFHLSSNLISAATNEIMKDPDLGERKTWDGIKDLFARYSYYATKRKEQIDILLDHVQSSPHPVILAGDLNDVAQSYAYRKLSKNKKDSFIEKGNWLGNTFGELFAMLRIDYILVDERIQVKSHKIEKVDFSDHYPIIAEIALN